MHWYISYRHTDSAGHVARLKRQLSILTPDVRLVFSEQFTTSSGHRNELESAVRQAKILLTVIGPHWLRNHPSEESFLKSANDLARLELITALKNNVPILPLLVQEAPFPSKKDLPLELISIANINATVLRAKEFPEDVQKMVALLQRQTQQEPWRSPAQKGTIRIATKDNGIIRRAWEVNEFSPVRILIDGVFYGSMYLSRDIRELVVEPGEHSITLENPAWPRLPRTIHVTVVPGQTLVLQASNHWFLRTISLEQTSSS